MAPPTPPHPQWSVASLPAAFTATCGGTSAQAGQVFVALFELDDWRTWLDEAEALLDPVEQRRAQGRRQSIDRERLILSYALHRLVLGAVLGCDASEVPIGRDPAGCPRVGAGGLHTSLSHAGGCAAVAVTTAGPVGIDIESASRAPVMAEIIERLCHPDDMTVLDRLPGALRNLALLRLWVRKEAYLKAAGIGLQREMNSFPAADDAVLALPSGAFTRVRMLDAGAEWIAAGAAPPDATFEVAWLRPARSAGDGTVLTGTLPANGRGGAILSFPN